MEILMHWVWSFCIAKKLPGDASPGGPPAGPPTLLAPPRSKFLAVPTLQPAPISVPWSGARICSASSGLAPAHMGGGKPPRYSSLKPERLELTEVQVGFHSQGKILPLLTFPCSREGEKTSFLFLTKRNLQMKRRGVFPGSFPRPGRATRTSRP